MEARGFGPEGNSLGLGLAPYTSLIEQMGRVRGSPYDYRLSKGQAGRGLSPVQTLSNPSSLRDALQSNLAWEEINATMLGARAEQKLAAAYARGLISRSAFDRMLGSYGTGYLPIPDPDLVTDKYGYFDPDAFVSGLMQGQGLSQPRTSFGNGQTTSVAGGGTSNPFEANMVTINGQTYSRAMAESLGLLDEEEDQYAKGGTVSTAKEPIIGWGMWSQRPQFMLGERGDEEMKIRPTEKPGALRPGVKQAMSRWGQRPQDDGDMELMATGGTAQAAPPWWPPGVPLPPIQIPGFPVTPPLPVPVTPPPSAGPPAPPAQPPGAPPGTPLPPPAAPPGWTPVGAPPGWTPVGGAPPGTPPPAPPASSTPAYDAWVKAQQADLAERQRVAIARAGLLKALMAARNNKGDLSAVAQNQQRRESEVYSRFGAFGLRPQLVQAPLDFKPGDEKLPAGQFYGIETLADKLERRNAPIEQQYAIEQHDRNLTIEQAAMAAQAEAEAKAKAKSPEAKEAKAKATLTNFITQRLPVFNGASMTLAQIAQKLKSMVTPQEYEMMIQIMEQEQG